MVPMQTESQTVVHSDPDILAGTPVFRGTRVPVQSLFDYLEGGETLDEFLDQFPSVSKKQALAALVAHEKALPFAPLVPNAVTIEAMKEARRGGLPRFASVEDLLDDLHAQD